MGNSITVAVGIDRDIPISLRNANDCPTAFTGADTPFAEIWGGLDTPVILNPPCDWSDPTQGKFKIRLVGSDTSSIMPGRYQIRFGVHLGDGRTVADDMDITFTDSPGATGSLSVYCTYQDMLDYDPSVEQQQTAEDLAGFVRQRHRARTWLDSVIIRHSGATVGWNSFALALFGNSIGGDCGGNSLNLNDLREYLDDNWLLITEQVTEITAKYALYLVYNAKIGPGDKQTQYQSLANIWYADVQRLIKGYQAELYQPGNTEVPMYVFHCGRSGIR